MAKNSKKKNVAKDAAVTDNFNTEKKNDAELQNLQKRLNAIQKKIEKKEKKLNLSDPTDDFTDGEDNGQGDTRSAFKMLKDMRNVYAELGGKTKLLDLLKSDDKLLMAMVKELMKIESTLMGAEIKNNQYGSGNTTTLVILKGLDTSDIVEKKKDDVVDLEQIAEAVNPTSVARIEYEEEMVAP
jgi:hypothetical protein